MATHVSDASSRAFRGGSPDELAVIAQRALAYTNASGTAIALSEGHADEIICRARAGSTAPEVGTASPIEGTFTGLCIQSGNELRCDDAETDSRVDQAAIRALGIRSMVAIPIKQRGRVTGVLAVFAPTAHAFTITHMAVLKTLADQIAGYLERRQQEATYSHDLPPAAPVKAAAVSAAASTAPPPLVAPKPAANASTTRQLPVVPKAVPVRAGTLAKEIAPSPFGKKEKLPSHEEQPESKTDSWFAFRTLSTVAARGKKPGASVLLIGAAAVVIIVVALGLSFELRKPTPSPQPAPEPLSSSATPAEAAPISANMQPPATNTPVSAPTTQEEARPGFKETIVLSARPSRISRTRDNSVASDVPAIALGSAPASGSLANLARPLSESGPSRILMQSELQPVIVLKKVAPVYPIVAKHQRLSGSVVVEGTVDKNGRISHLQLISGPPLFRDAAFEAVKQWVFKPARLNGRAIEQSTKIRLDFGAQ